MKKNGKKWRKIQKEKAMQRTVESATVECLVSNARKKKILCMHYWGRPGGILPGSCHSLLIKKSEKECICTKCRKIFPIKRMAQMEQLVSYLSNKGCITDEKFIAKLSRGIEPIYYYKISETKTEIDENNS